MLLLKNMKVTLQQHTPSKTMKLLIDSESFAKLLCLKLTKATAHVNTVYTNLPTLIHSKENILVVSNLLINSISSCQCQKVFYLL